MRLQHTLQVIALNHDLRPGHFPDLNPNTVFPHSEDPSELLNFRQSEDPHECRVDANRAVEMAIVTNQQ
jgi:hypothetical protein